MGTLNAVPSGLRIPVKTGLTIKSLAEPNHSSNRSRPHVSATAARETVPHEQTSSQLLADCSLERERPLTTVAQQCLSVPVVILCQTNYTHLTSDCGGGQGQPPP